MKKSGLVLALLLVAGTAGADQLNAAGWRKPTSEELAMTQEALAPGASAVYLYTQVDRNDEVGWEKNYRQIKVLTEAGRDLANISISYRQDHESIRDLQARVIQPDGKVIPFRGRILQRELVTTGTTVLRAMTLSLPDIRVGSIIEYHYKRSFLPGRIYDSHWLLSQNLFTRLARYRLTQNRELNLRMVAPQGWPPGAGRPTVEGKLVTYELRNAPAIVLEQFMPPPDDLQFRVDFIYSNSLLANPDQNVFWNQYGSIVHGQMQRFAVVNDAVRGKLADIVGEQDSEEQKARKIHAHVQGLRNTSFERPEEGAGSTTRGTTAATPRFAEEVGTLGHGRTGELALYFMTLLRAAGIAAEPLLAAGRGEQFFSRSEMDPEGLDTLLISAMLGGREVLFCPAVPYLAFGELPWTATAVDALKPGADSSQWMSLPAGRSTDAVTRRRGEFRLGEDGMLDGTVSVTFLGQEAFQRRMAQRFEDEVARRAYLEQDLGRHLPASAVIRLLEHGPWDTGEVPLSASFSVTVPDWAAVSGGRLLLGAGLFGNREKTVFKESTRQHPIYFGLPFLVEDEVHINPPAGYQLENPQPVPAPAQPAALIHAISVESTADAVVLRRRFGIDTLLAPASTYPQFQAFFNTVRAGDEQQVVLAR